ncbi:hypothetical protein SRS16P2_00480 (plasmid) [Variovorax sp. SRS16]|uniref:KleE stable inheritance protein n=1 Tax=Variovorax sp. SRS16 TaxID=282217 RepID=UPI001317D874|nr:KleE stable inheritance protein [Variovorax sp. SRS16]VTU46093.1 hypothetical protein SRS16P2_00480 [Variovorax sp. SRS16]
MTKIIIKSPGVAHAVAPAPSNPSRRLASLLRVSWILVALVSPPIRWFLGFDVVFQFGRFLFHQNLANGLTCLAHFSVYAALAYYTVFFKPRDL